MRKAQVVLLMMESLHNGTLHEGWGKKLLAGAALAAGGLAAAHGMGAVDLSPHIATAKSHLDSVAGHMGMGAKPAADHAPEPVAATPTTTGASASTAMHRKRAAQAVLANYQAKNPETNIGRDASKWK